jgi:hypothetical protein
MKLEEIAQLIQLLKANGVTRFKSDDIELKFGGSVSLDSSAAIIPTKIAETKAPPLQAIPPVDLDIVHHVNEVANLLKLGDEDLVDKLFPDYTQPSKEA